VFGHCLSPSATADDLRDVARALPKLGRRQITRPERGQREVQRDCYAPSPPLFQLPNYPRLDRLARPGTLLKYNLSVLLPNPYLRQRHPHSLTFRIYPAFCGIPPHASREIKYI